MNLKLSDISNIADVVSAVAIVISLIYVGLQVSDNTRATRSATANSATAISVSTFTAVSSSTESASVFHRGMTNPSLLDDGERTQFIFMVHTAYLAFQNSYYLSKEGTLDAEIQESLSQSIMAVKDQPGFRLYWAQRRSFLMKEFRNYVDERIDSDIIHEASEMYSGSGEKLAK
jgi:hypothetical protein